MVWCLYTLATMGYIYRVGWWRINYCFFNLINILMRKMDLKEKSWRNLLYCSTVFFAAVAVSLIGTQVLLSADITCYNYLKYGRSKYYQPLFFRISIILYLLNETTQSTLVASRVFISIRCIWHDTLDHTTRYQFFKLVL